MRIKHLDGTYWNAVNSCFGPIQTATEYPNGDSMPTVIDGNEFPSLTRRYHNSKVCVLYFRTNNGAYAEATGVGPAQITNKEKSDMSSEKICIGINKRSFLKDGMKYTVEMVQLDPRLIPAVTIWSYDFSSEKTLLLSSGKWNGVSYVCNDDDDPNLYGEDYEKVNSLCQEMAI